MVKEPSRVDGRGSPDVAQRPTHADGVALIQGVLSPNNGPPVLGLYVYSASNHVLRTLAKSREYRKIKPHLIGTPAILCARPGISQTELADFLGIERATAGLQVTHAIRMGWVRRSASDQDKRKYALYITPAGRRMLDGIIGLIAKHEHKLGGALSSTERSTLQSLLAKLIRG